MFHSARLKLTAWYLLIIMLISIFFSAIIYRELSWEVERSLRIQRYRILNPNLPIAIPVPTPQIDPDILDEVNQRILLNLLYTNGAILIISGIAGYFLAGRTLKPIEQMMFDQNRFITDASHELRTPLTSLKTVTEVNLRDGNLSLDEAKSVLQSNLEDINNLQMLSDSLIKLAQFQQPQGKIPFSQISVNKIINDSITKVTKYASQKEIRIEDNTTNINAIVLGDEKSLVELVIILLDNAIKYSPAQSLISINSEINNDQVFIDVRDQGMGINEKDVPHIFDRFYRADKSRTKENIPGYGLGLSIAQKIVKMHNGNISVQSKPEQGTTFTIILPLAPDKINQPKLF